MRHTYKLVFGWGLWRLLYIWQSISRTHWTMQVFVFNSIKRYWYSLILSLTPSSLSLSISYNLISLSFSYHTYSFLSLSFYLSGNDIKPNGWYWPRYWSIQTFLFGQKFVYNRFEWFYCFIYNLYYTYYRKLQKKYDFLVGNTLKTINVYSFIIYKILWENKIYICIR